jgi:hypothetical protein
MQTIRVTYNDVIATLLVAAIMVPYIGYLAWGDMPFTQDPRGMAATGLILGLAAAAVAGRASFERDPLHRAALGSGIIALVLGIAAVWAETEVLLALFIAAIVVTWALGEFASTRGSVTTGHPLAHHA